MTKSPQTIAAEKKVAEVLDAIFYSTTSLTHALIKAYRNGMDGKSGVDAIVLVGATLDTALEAYKTAIAQPETKPAIRPVVNL